MAHIIQLFDTLPVRAIAEAAQVLTLLAMLAALLLRDRNYRRRIENIEHAINHMLTADAAHAELHRRMAMRASGKLN